MVTLASKKRMERRRLQQMREWYTNLPEYQALRREIARRQRYRQRHPYSGQHVGVRGLLYMHCVTAGIERGGRPPMARRCLKRLGSRLCWNWRVPGTDRCYRHHQRHRADETSPEHDIVHNSTSPVREGR
jgi:hypothetical protein